MGPAAARTPIHIGLRSSVVVAQRSKGAGKPPGGAAGAPPAHAVLPQPRVAPTPHPQPLQGREAARSCNARAPQRCCPRSISSATQRARLPDVCPPPSCRAPGRQPRLPHRHPLWPQPCCPPPVDPPSAARRVLLPHLGLLLDLLVGLHAQRHAPRRRCPLGGERRTPLRQQHTWPRRQSSTGMVLSNLCQEEAGVARLVQPRSCCLQRGRQPVGATTHQGRATHDGRHGGHGCQLWERRQVGGEAGNGRGQHRCLGSLASGIVGVDTTSSPSCFVVVRAAPWQWLASPQSPPPGEAGNLVPPAQVFRFTGVVDNSQSPRVPGLTGSQHINGGTAAAPAMRLAMGVNGGPPPGTCVAVHNHMQGNSSPCSYGLPWMQAPVALRPK